MIVPPQAWLLEPVDLAGETEDVLRPARRPRVESCDEDRERLERLFRSQQDDQLRREERCVPPVVCNKETIMLPHAPAAKHVYRHLKKQQHKNAQELPVRYYRQLFFAFLERSYTR